MSKNKVTCNHLLGFFDPSDETCFVYFNDSNRMEQLEALKEWDGELFNFCPYCGISIEAPRTNQPSNIDMFNKLVQRRVQ